jgi:hypothetical protein
MGAFMPSPGQSDYDASYVYIAVSRKLGVGRYKIGLSRHPYSRRDELNANAYGGTTDWWIAECREVSSMRAVEGRLHESFGEHVEIEGLSDTEIFAVAYPQAVNFPNHFAALFRPRFPVGNPYRPAE